MNTIRSYLKTSRFFSFLVTDPPVTVLGRWKVEYGKSLETKANLSNEDHCGPCGQYVLQKQGENIQALHRRNRQVLEKRA